VTSVFLTKPEQIEWARCAQQTSKSKYSQLFSALYSRPALRKTLLLLIRKMEGGDFFSQSLREIFKRYHNIEVGPYSYGCFLPDAFPSGTQIGAYVSMADNIYFLRRNHPHERLSQHPFFYNKYLQLVKEDTIDDNEDNPLVIENDVWVGRQTIILPGCKRIGNGAIIGAGSVVTKDVPAFTIVGGNPAKKIKARFSEQCIDKIEKSAWWQRDILQLIKADFPFVDSVDESLMENFCRRLENGDF